MISMEAVIRQLGPQALHELQQVGFDRPVLLVLENRIAPGRNNVLRKWFESYKVFVGIDNPRRDAIVAAVLQWADNRDPERDLTTGRSPGPEFERSVHRGRSPRVLV